MEKQSSTFIKEANQFIEDAKQLIDEVTQWLSNFAELEREISEDKIRYNNASIEHFKVCVGCGSIITKSCGK